MLNLFKNSKFIIPSILFLGCIFNTFNFNSFPIALLSNFINVLIFFIIPGFLVLHILNIQRLRGIETVVYVPLLSIVVVIISGLLINQTHFLFGVTKPLQANVVTLMFAIFMLVLVVVANKVRKGSCYELPILELNNFSKSFIIIALFTLIIGLLGTSLLNFSENNALVTVSVLYMLTYFLFLVLFHKNISYDAFPILLFLFTLNAITLYSMRSWYVHGFDIHQELFVFNLTKSNFLWDIANFRDPYNACLSITILPTILSSVFDLDSNYIFKFFLPAIFSLMPPLLYLMFSKFTSSTKAFLAAMFFAVQGQFINQMPALLRQGVALTLFVFALEVLFNDKIERTRKNILIALAGTGMILSHYSTTYIALAALTAAYVVPRVCNHLFKEQKAGQNIRLTTLIYLLVVAISWNVLLTSTSGNLISIVGSTVDNLDGVLSSELRSERVLKAVFYYEGGDTKRFESLLDAINFKYAGYVNEKSLYENHNDEIYDVKKYPVEYPHTNQTIRRAITMVFHLVIPITFRISIVIGLLMLLVKTKRKNMSLEFMSLCVTMVLFIVAIVVLPNISVNYNIERLYQQALIFLSLPAILGFYLTRKIPEHLITNMVGLLIGLYFITNIGLTDNWINKVPSVVFSNSGDHYDRYYVKDTEIASLHWLDTNKDPLAVIYADRYATLRIKSYSRTIYFRDVIQEIFPVTITKNSYVYSSAVNTLKNKTFGNYNDYIINYYYPKEFLETNKNVIYNNSATKVYR